MVETEIKNENVNGGSGMNKSESQNKMTSVKVNNNVSLVL